MAKSRNIVSVIILTLDNAAASDHCRQACSRILFFITERQGKGTNKIVIEVCHAPD
jgi:hypothetical protein